MLQHHRRLQELQRQRLELLPRCLPQLQRQRQQLEQGSSQEGEDSSEEQERWQQLQQLSAAAADAQRQLGLAAELHAQCCAALRGRLWWRDAHLLPQPAATVAAALQDGGASPDALLALAAVNAFIHPLWLAQVVQEWR